MLLASVETTGTQQPVEKVRTTKKLEKFKKKFTKQVIVIKAFIKLISSIIKFDREDGNFSENSINNNASNFTKGII